MSEKGTTFFRVGINEYTDVDDTLNVTVDYLVPFVYFGIASTDNNVGLSVTDARELAKFILNNTPEV